MITAIGKESLADFATGDGTIGTTPGQLSPGGLVNKHVVVRANGGNGDGNVIIVGPSADTVANGFVLPPGVRSPPICVDDLSKVWLIGTTGATNPTLTADDSLLTNGVDPAAVVIVRETKTFHVSFTADGGTYTLTLNGDETAAINFDADATAVALAINTAAGSTVVSATGAAGSFDINYLGGQGYSWIAS